MMTIALHYGFDNAKRFFDRAHDMDNHFFDEPPQQDIPGLMGLLGVWNSTFGRHGARALLPYSQALLRFAAHIQQVDMESNGERVAQDGTVLPFEAGEIGFEDPSTGTNGQLFFYQLIHQGWGWSPGVRPVSLSGAAGGGAGGEPRQAHVQLLRAARRPGIRQDRRGAGGQGGAGVAALEQGLHLEPAVVVAALAEAVHLLLRAAAGRLRAPHGGAGFRVEVHLF